MRKHGGCAIAMDDHHLQRIHQEGGGRLEELGRPGRVVVPLHHAHGLLACVHLQKQLAANIYIYIYTINTIKQRRIRTQ